MRKNFKDVGFYPQPVLIIGTYDADGVPDAMNVGWGGLVGGGYVEINISQGHKTTENLSLKGGLHRELCRPGAPDGSGLCGSGLRPHHPGQDCPGRAHPGAECFRGRAPV